MLPTFDFHNIIRIGVRTALVGGLFNPIVFFTTATALLVTFQMKLFGNFLDIGLPVISFTPYNFDSSGDLVDLVCYVLSVDTLVTILNFVIAAVNKLAPAVVASLSSALLVFVFMIAFKSIHNFLVELSA